ncbi:BMC domain-containing protein [Veillonella sp.]|uniref:BMC domain-containing protein n=1 Tax=Veillonella sp. TaxID=1926307 RepID=UPI0025F6F9ED|nr:BMC domain-containing protein [Veillonella sp.]
MKDALGLVEVAGLATAIQVADAMVKSANVTIIDIEKAKGNGWMTVKVRGDVGAVQAAVQAGAAQAEQFGHLIAQKVIPRPAEGLDTWLLASGGNAVLQGFAEETTVDEAKASTDVSKTAVEKQKATAVKPKAVDEAKAAKTDMLAKSEAATELDDTKSALLEVFKPGSTAKAEAKSTTATSKSSTATKSSATGSGTASKASSTVKATSSTTPKGAPKKRPSRAKTTKPKA